MPFLAFRSPRWTSLAVVSLVRPNVIDVEKLFECAVLFCGVDDQKVIIFRENNIFSLFFSDAVLENHNTFSSHTNMTYYGTHFT